ncbi:DEAD/DEAH box helicase family protein [bacterium]|nr:DEAD/DEAH box helicase family protein [bacterium]
MKKNYTDLQFNFRYRSGDNSALPHDFYSMILPYTKLYQRAVGFFSSSSFVELSDGIISLIENNGKMQLITSPRLNSDDIDAIEKGYKNKEDVYLIAFKREMKVPQNIEESNKLDILAQMIESGFLDIKIAVTDKPSFSMYHEKIGVFTDLEGNQVVISGSNNESENAINENFESFDVFCGWKESETERVKLRNNDFLNMWENKQNNLSVIDFPALPKMFIQKYRIKNNDTQINIPNEPLDIKPNDVLVDDNIQRGLNDFTMPADLKLHKYQDEAIEQWERQNFIGIYDMATGTGKTLTALSSISRLFTNKSGTFCVIILCPYIHLVTQWVEDIVRFNCKPIIGFGSSPQKDWKKRLERAVVKRNYKDNNEGFFCFITTVATFKSEYVQSYISKIRKDILLVADEAHNLGAQNAKKYLLPEKYKYRLALSATMERHFDDDGTKQLLDFFGEKCIEYDLGRAIREGYLVPYKYYPIVVTLDEEEREKYVNITRSISQEIEYDKKTKKQKLTEMGKLLCIMRSRIIAGCHQKIPALISQLKNYKDKNMILIYCGAVKFDEDILSEDDDEITKKQIDEVIQRVYDEYKMKICRFTAEVTIDEREIIKEKFAQGEELQAIAAIKCLDEGVNIPSIKTAFILASSTNPKEYIQRRGRVLRLYKNKEYAEIYDFITLPYELETSVFLTEFEKQTYKALIYNEIQRINEFASLALNGTISEDLVQNIKHDFHINDDEVLEVI